MELKILYHLFGFEIVWVKFIYTMSAFVAWIAYGGGYEARNHPAPNREASVLTTTFTAPVWMACGWVDK